MEVNTHLSRLGELLGPPGTPQPLDGGITNRNFKVRFGDADYVVRLPGKDTELLGIDRRGEWAATSAAAAIGIGPQTAVMLEDPPVLVTRFVEGKPVAPADLRAPGAIAEVAGSLRRVHDSGRTLPTTFSPFRVVERYAALVGDPPPDYEHAQLSARRIEAALSGADHTPVPCHNDLLAANFIRCPNGYCIVDWEYAGMGDRYFDLGNFAVNNELDDAGEDLLLTAYYDQPPNRARRAALKLMRFMSDFREAMWGLVQSTISELDFDFDGYARSHFDRLPPDIDGWLEEARGAGA